MSWTLQTKNTSTYLKKLGASDTWLAGDSRITAGQVNLTAGYFGLFTAWGFQDKAQLTEQRTLDIGGEYGIDIGGGFLLNIQPQVGTYLQATPNSSTYSIQNRAATALQERSLDIGGGYALSIGGGNTLNIQSASTGDVWSYQIPN